jgi:hypothetical protein
MNYDISNRINVLIKKTYYTYERFGVDATFALLYHEEPLSVVELALFVRISDHLMKIDENHYFIIFAFTSEKNAYKASQNIIHKLDSHFNDHSACIALDSLDPKKTPQNVLNRLKQIMCEIHRDSHIRVETEDILHR